MGILFYNHCTIHFFFYHIYIIGNLELHLQELPISAPRDLGFLGPPLLPPDQLYHCLRFTLPYYRMVLPDVSGFGLTEPRMG